MVDPNEVRVRWRKLVGEANTAGLVDHRTVRVPRFCCFSRIAKDLSRYRAEVQYALLFGLLVDPTCSPRGDGIEHVLALRLCQLLDEGEYLQAANLIEGHLGLLPSER